MPDVMVDSNVIYSGLVFKGKPARVLKAILDGKMLLIIPEDQLEELYILFKRKSPDFLYLLEAYVFVAACENSFSREISEED